MPATRRPQPYLSRYRRPLQALLLCALLGPASLAALAQNSLSVQASAYNSLPGQGIGDPSIGAWGDRLQPGMKSIAVSRDLLAAGLGHGATVRIDGLPGEYRVLDKMNARWQRKIDIYFGEDRNAALEWGNRRVTIRWD